MENRIKIGDDWYIKEVKDDVSIKEDFTYSRIITYECSNFMIEGSVIEYDGKFTMPTLGYTDKKDPDASWVATNPAYFIGIVNRNSKWMTC